MRYYDLTNARQSSTAHGFPAEHAIDKDSNSYSKTEVESNPWLKVGHLFKIKKDFLGTLQFMNLDSRSNIFILTN